MTHRIDFWIAGAQKSGTTTLFDILAEHPDVFMPRAKEIHYFTRDEFHSQGPRYLDAFYADAPEDTLVGGAYVHSLFFHGCAERMYAHNPEMKVLAALRDPIERAYSAYWFARRNGWETAETFEQALALEEERAGGDLTEQAELTYVRHGYYAEQLAVFADVFGRDRLHVVFTATLQRHPARTIGAVLDFLGLQHVDVLDAGKHSNVAGLPRSLALQRVLLRESGLKRAVRRITSARFRQTVHTHLLRPLAAWNVRPAIYPPMALETRARLSEVFAPHNEALARFVGHELPGWG